MKLDVIKGIYKKKSEENEKKRLKALNDVLEALRKLREEIFFEDAYLFGSVTRPYSFGEHSDIDIAFQGLYDDKLFYATGFLSSSVERDVNVVKLESIHFKENILKNGIRWKRN
ncbi:MAG: nucleotidyltransferase family protein [Candidatus Loosdrechtia sp.]|uniref:nucleotidyltransferase family protein n=1 Tax=Candidatus Loosdrechtia sp. TaxID=3101272 RepID=UPI003A6294F7|nr:MAG: nucleotidyltransferase domain-containing protein [Candidatus Jettenia sp. AMX2]